MTRTFRYAKAGGAAVAEDGTEINAAFVEVIDPKTGKPPTWASGARILFTEFNVDTWEGYAFAPATPMGISTEEIAAAHRGEEIENIVFLSRKVPVTGFYEIREITPA